MKYTYIELSDKIQEGDEYHHYWMLWFPVEPNMIGKKRGQVFSYRTKVRREKP